MEFVNHFETKVALTPRDLRNKIPDLDVLLEKKIKEQYEGKCSRNGYVLSDSVKLISRSIGLVEKGRYTGDILFYAEASARVLQPPDGVEVVGVVERKNRMGIYVNYRDAIRIMIPRDLHVGQDDFVEFDSILPGDKIRVEIKKSRYQVNDMSILSVGVFKGKEGGPTVPRGEFKVVGEEGEEGEAGEEGEEAAAEEAGEEGEEAAAEAADEEAGEEADEEEEPEFGAEGED
jgi:DNA-directed RNA polymerase subunit E'/Rpb7